MEALSFCEPPNQFILLSKRNTPGVRLRSSRLCKKPADLDIHLVLDNYATHKAPPVKAWLARHPRYHLHFTPTSASWLNQVERWFALLADKQIKRDVHRSVDRLKADIAAFIQAHNDQPKPFISTKTADAILQTIARYCSDTLATHAAIS